MSDDDRKPYNTLTVEGKEERTKYLWKRAIAKIKGAVLVLVRFGDLEKRINLFGTSIQFDFELNEELKPAIYIILPNSRFKTGWNFIMIFLLLYTATFVPIRTAFIDEVTPMFEAFEYTVDGCFIFDLFVNFLSAYTDQDKNLEIGLK
jgi:hypothetical protein